MKRYRGISFLLTLLLLFSSFTLYACEVSAKTENSEPDYIEITTVSDFLSISEAPDLNYRLVNDISFEDTEINDFCLIPEFTGVFDGAGHSISDIQLMYSVNNKSLLFKGGIFGENSGTIKNLCIENSVFDYDFQTSADLPDTYCGIITATNSGIIESCVVKNTDLNVNTYTTSPAPYSVVTNAVYTGGITGENKNTVKNCYTDMRITATAPASYPNALEYAVAGGIVGIDNDSNKDIGSAIINCYSSSQLYSDHYAGGIVGETNFSSVSSCFFDGEVEAPSSAGGIIGVVSRSSSLYGCVNCGSVLSKNQAGGIVATAVASSITNCSNSGTVISSDEKDVAKLYAAGIISYAFSCVIENCVNSGDIFANAPGSTSYVYTGGIAGRILKTTEQENHVRFCVNTGNISTIYTKINETGAVVGKNSSSTVLDSYYLEGTYNTGIGVGNGETFMITEKQMQEQTTFEGFDFENTWEIDMDSGIISLRLPGFAMVSLSGSSFYTETLTADIFVVFPKDAEVFLQWSRNGTTVAGNTKTYTVYKADVNSLISVAVSANGSQYVSFASVTGEKQPQAIPAPPVFLSSTDTTVTLQPVAGREYSCGGDAWQSSNIFNNLTPDTEYIFYTRMIETDGYAPSDKSEGTTVFTQKNQSDVQVSFIGEAVYGERLSVIVEGLPETSELSYQWYVGETPVGDDSDGYVIYSAAFGKSVRCEITVNDSYIITSGSRIAKQSQKTPPAAPVLVNRTSSSISVVPVLGVEFSIDGKTWQTEATFTGLEPGTVYYVYARRPGTSNYLPSIARKLKTVTSVDDSEFEVTISGSGKYDTPLTVDINGIDTYGKTVTYQWQRGDEAVGADTDSYVCYIADIDCDITVTVTVDGKVAVSNAIKGRKGDNNSSVPPVLIDKTSTSLILEPVAGREYSIDGHNWQISNIFNDLEPDTEYNVYMRRAESKAYNPGPASNPLIVKTHA